MAYVISFIGKEAKVCLVTCLLFLPLSLFAAHKGGDDLPSDPPPAISVRPTASEGGREGKRAGAELSKRPPKGKESYPLREESFSPGSEVNFPGLYRHLHYTFKNKDLFLQALFPLLPKRLQQGKMKFDQLEFLGDAVLGLLTRERLLALFPDRDRGMHNALYSALTRNETLAEVYGHNLNIEQYLPYPGTRTCKYCNVVEALIGAIYTDEGNALVESRKFAMRILDDHTLREKLERVSPGTSHPLTLSSIKLSLEEILASQGEAMALNPKSFLSILLEKSLRDRPEYMCTLGKDEATDSPCFISYVVGAQIGQRILGKGITRVSAEEDAARNAIFFVTGRNFFPTREEEERQTYTHFVHKYAQAQGLQYTYSTQLEPPSFVVHIPLGEQIIEGMGATKKEARENAAKMLVDRLVTEGTVALCETDTTKMARTLLKEWADQRKIEQFCFVDIDPLTSQHPCYQFTLTLRKSFSSDEVVTSAEAKGCSHEEAREEAHRLVFNNLLRIQEEEKQRVKPSRVAHL